MEISPKGRDHVTPSEGNNEDEEVNILDDFNPVEERREVERDLQDATESSSSFGCTDSETENAAMLGDEEVESQIREDNASLVGFDGSCGLFRMRKKKVSDHWRDFIRPLMWRCKWVELCVRELNSKASKYEKEIAGNYERKQNEWEKNATEDLCMRSTPFICQDRQKVMKRRKRRRVEETVDLSSYTSCHNLFSYYANRKPCAGSAYMDYGRHNADSGPAETDSFDDASGVNDELPAFDFNKNDPFESILRKIEEAQSQVRQLMVRMDKVVTENAEKFTSDIASSAPCDPLASCALNPNSLNVDGDSLRTISPQTAGKRLFVPESVVYNTGEETPLPNMTESLRPIKCENMENNGFLTHNQPVKQELNNTTEEVGVQRIGNPLLGSKGLAIQHPNSPSKMMVPREQQSVKGRSIFKPTTLRKRKRGRRKPRTGRWSRRSSGSG